MYFISLKSDSSDHFFLKWEIFYRRLQSLGSTVFDLLPHFVHGAIVIHRPRPFTPSHHLFIRAVTGLEQVSLDHFSILSPILKPPG
jgi:hypothetical protein